MTVIKCTLMREYKNELSRTKVTTAKKVLKSLLLMTWILNFVSDVVSVVVSDVVVVADAVVAVVVAVVVVVVADTLNRWSVMWAVRKKSFFEVFLTSKILFIVFFGLRLKAEKIRPDQVTFHYNSSFKFFNNVFHYVTLFQTLNYNMNFYNVIWQ